MRIRKLKKAIATGMLGLVCATLYVGIATPVSAEDLCTIAKESIQAASRIRGLAIKHQVPCLVQDKAQVKKFLLDSLRDKIPAEKLRYEGVVYKALGLLPESFDYENGLVDLYVSQIGGYYDPDKAHYIMAAWMPGILQTTVAVHELTHALQDQYFNLKTFIDNKSDNSDEQQAHSALVEGDATAVMTDYPRELMGQPPIAKDQNVEGLMMQNVLGMGLVGSSTSVPQTLQNMLIFPYTSGLRFVHHLLRIGGYREVDKAFMRAPRSTEEILHPEIYVKGGAPGFIKISDDTLLPKDVPGHWTKVYSDTLGEFTISSLLGSFIVDKAKAVDAAAGWAGDRVAVFQGDSRRMIVWNTHWDTQIDSDEFSAAYKEVLAKRFPNVSKLGPELTEVGRGQSASFAQSGLDTEFRILDLGAQ